MYIKKNRDVSDEPYICERALDQMRPMMGHRLSCLVHHVRLLEMKVLPGTFIISGVCVIAYACTSERSCLGGDMRYVIGKNTQLAASIAFRSLGWIFGAPIIGCDMSL